MVLYLMFLRIIRAKQHFLGLNCYLIYSNCKIHGQLESFAVKVTTSENDLKKVLLTAESSGPIEQKNE